MDNLTLLVFLPIVGALLVAATPRDAVGAQRAITMVTMLATMVLGLAVCLHFDGSSAAAQHVVQRPWFSLPAASGSVPIQFKLGLDGLSVLMVALTALLGPIVVLSTWGHIHERVKEFMVWVLVMQAGMLGVFLALDLVLFYVFWEVSLVPLYFILGIWGGDRRLYATLKFFLYTLSGSLVMMVAVIALIYQVSALPEVLQLVKDGNSVPGADITRLIDYVGLLPHGTQVWMFGAFALAFAIKVPMMPFHTWLPDAHTEAPTSGSVILAGVLLKMGTYGLLRFCIAPFPGIALEASPWMMAIGATGIVYGAWLASAQNDLKRLVACSSVSHLGYVVLGLFALTQAGLRGSVLQMVNHGISTGLLFLLVGMIYERRHTRMLDQYGGIASVMPLYAVFFVITVLSSVGLPGLNGFVGEYLILLGAFQASPWVAAVSVTGVVFGAVYLLMATRRLLWGPLTNAANRALADITPREIGLMVPLVVLCAWIGFAPNTFLSRADASIDALMLRIDKARATRVALQEQGAAGPRTASALEQRAEDGIETLNATHAIPIETVARTSAEETLPR